MGAGSVGSRSCFLLGGNFVATFSTKKTLSGFFAGPQTVPGTCYGTCSTTFFKVRRTLCTWKDSASAKSSRPSVLSRNTAAGLMELKQRHHCMNILIDQHVFQILSKKRWLCLKSKNVLSDLKISALNCFSLIKLG